MTIPFIAFYGDNWLKGTSELTAEQKGLLIDIVALMMDEAGPIERNDGWLARKLRFKSAARLTKALDQLVADRKLIEENGLVWSPRALTEIEASLAKSEKCRTAAKNQHAQRRARKSNKNNGGSGGHPHGDPVGAQCYRDGDEEYTLEPKGSKGADAPKPLAQNTSPDPAKLLFDSGVALLTAAGHSEAGARSFLGKARKHHPDSAIIEAIGKAQREGAVDPAAFIRGCLKQHVKTSAVPQIGDERVTKDGRTMVWAGAIDQWVEVRM